MTPVRAAAAAAALFTTLLLQATLIGPLSGFAAVSLPAVLVAVVALSEGPGTGMALGFSAGLLADLGSEHPAGVLAVTWLGVGIVCGAAADRQRRFRARAVLAGVVCGLGAVVSAVLLALVASAGFGLATLVDAGWAALGDALLAMALIPVVRLFLRSHALALSVGLRS